jgi:hypothetical protein
MFVVLKKDYFGQKAGTTLDIDEPHTKSLLDQGIVEAVKGNPYGPLMAKVLEASIAALTKNIDQVITAADQQMALAQTKSRKNAVPEIFGPGGEGDPKKNFGGNCVVAAADRAELEAWTSYARVLMMASEFLFVD